MGFNNCRSGACYGFCCSDRFRFGKFLLRGLGYAWIIFLMESSLDSIISFIYGLVIMLPLIYSILFLIKAIFRPQSLPQISSFFDSPFKSKVFNIIATKSILCVMLLFAVFSTYFGISVYCSSSLAYFFSKLSIAFLTNTT
ncbi:hypothetical protein D1BOALGB6SA_3723 [Olavius sp. associated proteobacterium Delta 1]|nr:hypothetical protein D1BOALGB6SA_3723 [Olavius sp. associated proteobacterium Delta 1]